MNVHESSFQNNYLYFGFTLIHEKMIAECFKGENKIFHVSLCIQACHKIFVVSHSH